MPTATIETLRPSGCRRWERGRAAPDVWFSECGRFSIQPSITWAYLLNDLGQIGPSGEGAVVARRCESLVEAMRYAEYLVVIEQEAR